MKAIIFILFVMLVGCSNSTDSSNQPKQLSAYPDIDGTWEVLYYRGVDDYTNTETFKTTSAQIMFQSKWYDCAYKDSSVQWSYLTPEKHYYSYTIELVDKDNFIGHLYIKIPDSTAVTYQINGGRK